MSVYFVQAIDTGYIKIGHARSVTKRLATLQTGQAKSLNVLCEIRGGAMEERGFHEAFAQHRVRGEWFRPHQDILRWIAKFTGAKPSEPLKASKVADGLLKFFSEVIDEETDDGKAARQLMRRFVDGSDEVRSALFAAREN